MLAEIYDADRPGSMAGVLVTLCRVAGAVRDRISRDMWRVVNDLADFHRHRGPPILPIADPTLRNGDAHARLPTLSEALDLLDHSVLTLAAFSGLAMDSVTRGDGWRFLDLGRKLERSVHTVTLLRNTLVFVGEPESPMLEALLEIADSSMTYRRRYQGSVEPAAVLDLLLADEEIARWYFNWTPSPRISNICRARPTAPRARPSSASCCKSQQACAWPMLTSWPTSVRTASAMIWKSCCWTRPLRCPQFPTPSRKPTSVTCSRRTPLAWVRGLH